MTLPLSKQFSMVFVIFRHYFYFFFLSLSILLYTNFLKSLTLRLYRARILSTARTHSLTHSRSFAGWLACLSIETRWFSSFWKATNEIKQNEMKINIEVDFNFPPDYGNPVCHSFVLRFAWDVLSVEIFVIVVVIAECVRACLYATAPFNVYKSQMLWQMIIVCSKRSNVKNEQ